MKDGNYQIEVLLEGGSGRANITSPTELVVKDGIPYAQIEWSSPNYDYMIIDNVTIYPINEEGNSKFEMPVTQFDTPIEVIADTTAMSMPHEITYTMTFDSESIHSAKSPLMGVGIVGVGIFLLILVGIRKIFLKIRKL